MLALAACRKGGVSKDLGSFLKDQVLTPHPHHATLCSPCWQSPTSRKVVPNGPRPKKGVGAAFQSVPWPLDSVCLSLMMASCVLWTAQQDMELGLSETELGPKAAKLRIGAKQKRTIDSPFPKHVLGAFCENVPPTVGKGSLFTTSCLA